MAPAPSVPSTVLRLTWPSPPGCTLLCQGPQGSEQHGMICPRSRMPGWHCRSERLLFGSLVSGWEGHTEAWRATRLPSRVLWVPVSTGGLLVLAVSRKAGGDRCPLCRGASPGWAVRWLLGLELGLATGSRPPAPAVLHHLRPGRCLEVRALQLGPGGRLCCCWPAPARPPLPPAALCHLARGQLEQGV